MSTSKVCSRRTQGVAADDDESKDQKIPRNREIPIVCTDASTTLVAGRRTFGPLDAG